MRCPGRGPRAALVSSVAALASVLGGPPAARPGDITVFASVAEPRELWGTGYGAALSSSVFRVLSFEGEAARLNGEFEEDNIISFTGSALLAPPIGFLTPYGGLGVGLFRQSVGDRTDTGRLRAMILGAKVKIGGLVVLKAEYRRIDLSGEPLLELEHRLSVGAGISF